MIRDTCGPLFDDSSPHDDLQWSLENRLRQRLGETGSMEYALTWTSWPMRWGPPICALRASGPRTSDSDSTGWLSGWPTPNVMEGGQTSRSGDRKDELLLGGLARTSGWPTPAVTNADRGGMLERTEGERRNLQDFAILAAGWPTPRSITGGPESAERKQELGRTESGGGDLQAAAKLAGWPTPDAAVMNVGADLEMHRQRLLQLRDKHRNGNGAGLTLGIASQLTRGETPSGSPASTVSSGVLNAVFVQWLMGFPSDWLMAAPSVKTLRGAAR